MAAERLAPEDWGQYVKAVLLPLREARGLSTAQMAKLMGMQRRSYANFEAGKGYLRLDKIFAFAAITNTDPWAILAALYLGLPDLARDAAKNKAVTVFLLALRDFHRAIASDMDFVHPTEALIAFTDAFKVLEATAIARREEAAPAWLNADRTPDDNEGSG